MSLNWQRIAHATELDNGPLAFGSDVSASRLHAAALAGFYCFPTATYEQTLLNEMRYGADVDTGVRTIAVNDPDPYSVAWLNPDPRPVIDLTSRGAGRSMRRLARRHGQWRTTIDVAFDDVVTRCAQHRGSSWITSALRKSLRNLHDAGVAHSCEVWDDDQLIGGVFGLRLGAVFTADSQFTAVEGAGKLAVVDLMTRFAQSGGTLLDLQHDTPHARTLGATAMPRSSYLTALQRLNTQRTIISSEARSAKHIAELNTA